MIMECEVIIPEQFLLREFGNKMRIRYFYILNDDGYQNIDF